MLCEKNVLCYYRHITDKAIFQQKCKVQIWQLFRVKHTRKCKKDPKVYTFESYLFGPSDWS